MTDMIKCKELYESLKELSFISCNIYNENYNSQFLKEARFDWTIDREGKFLQKRLETELLISNQENFKKTVKIFEDDKHILPLLGKTIGTSEGTILCTGANIISIFIQQYYENNADININTYDQFYLSLETFLFDEFIYKSFKDLIINFDSDEEKIVFSKDYSIRKLTKTELIKRRLNQDRNYFYYAFQESYNSFFIIENLTKIKKEVFEKSETFSSTNKIDIRPIKKEFEKILKSLRVLKLSNVILSNTIICEYPYFHPNCGRSSINDIAPILYNIKPCKVNIIECGELKSLWNKIKKSGDDIVVPLNRLFHSIDRSDLIDELIDLIIGLESIYKSSGSVHLNLRCAFTLEKTDKHKAKELYNFLDEMRELRNKIVHGSSLKKEEKDITEEKINKLEEILRKSIKLKLLEPHKFNISSKEWNEIYFD